MSESLGMTALMSAAGAGRLGCVRLLVRDTNHPSPYLMAVPTPY